MSERVLIVDDWYGERLMPRWQMPVPGQFIKPALVLIALMLIRDRLPAEVRARVETLMGLR
jgi:hypothetical protein